MELGLKKLAEDQKQDSKSALMTQSIGKLGLSKAKASKEEKEDTTTDSNILAEKTKQSGENTMDKKADMMDQSMGGLGLSKTKKKASMKKEAGNIGLSKIQK